MIYCKFLLLTLTNDKPIFILVVLVYRWGKNMNATKIQLTYLCINKIQQYSLLCSFVKFVSIYLAYEVISWALLFSPNNKIIRLFL